VLLYTIQGKATIARRSPICETNWPAHSSRKLPLRANDVDAGFVAAAFASIVIPPAEDSR